MIGFWLIVLLLAAGVASWAGARVNDRLGRWIALLALGAGLIWLLAFWGRHGAALRLGDGGTWLAELDRPWIPRFGIGFHLAVDGLSLVLAVLTFFLGLVSVLYSWRDIESRVGFFHFNLLWSLAGILGVFFALDLFLFFVFWEVMLVPMYFLIAIWGHERRVYSAVKFFIFTQASSLLMLVGIVGLALIELEQSGRWSFDYSDLAQTAVAPGAARWLMLAFFIAFAVKLPAVPFHPWLADAHTAAPTAGSVILAGVLLKTGAYGLIRFVVGLFPAAAADFAPVAMLLGAVGVVYGAWLAFAQTDFKRVVAYSSISHLGFVLLGVFALNELAASGAVVVMVAHGLSTGGLFLVAGALGRRLGTRDLREIGGLWAQFPRLGAVALFFAIASLALPGLGNFVGEFLVLLGAFRVDRVATIVAALGIVLAAVYSLTLIHRSFNGRLRGVPHGPDLGRSEVAYLAAMAVILIWLGVRPQPVLDAVGPALTPPTAAEAREPAERPDASRGMPSAGFGASDGLGVSAGFSVSDDLGVSARFSVSDEPAEPDETGFEAR